jgi:hypothetical protein
MLVLLRLCRARGIPTVFWNKEDPVHFSTFLPLARHFDYVFTTDIDCIARYKWVLKHDRVNLLPFAAQPRFHNPLEIAQREPAFSFAGSWYRRYPKRQSDFIKLKRVVEEFGPVKIFDRSFGKNSDDTRFPEGFTSDIIGYLPFDKIDRAYKGYRYSLNVNTVQHSQTMFARRVFELIASNTVVVSNAGLGMSNLFGDLVVASDDLAVVQSRLRALWHVERSYRRHRLMALRAVLAEHTYTHRLEYIHARIEKRSWAPARPPVVILAVADSTDEERRIVLNVRRQRNPCTALVLRRYSGRRRTTWEVDEQNVCFFDEEGACHSAALSALRTHKWCALFVPEDFYGPHYLTDLANARHYSDADVVGKASYYLARGQVCELQDNGRQYRLGSRLLARASLGRSDSISPDWIGRCFLKPRTISFDALSALSIDEFHYCRDGAFLPEAYVLSCVGDLPIRDLGLSLSRDILPAAESVTASDYRPAIASKDALVVDASTLRCWLEPRLPAGISLSIDGDELLLISKLAEYENANLYADPRLKREEKNLVANNQVRLLVEHDLSALETVFEYQDADKLKIGHTINGAGSAYSLLLPDDCVYLRFALRVRGAGTARIRGLVLGSTIDPPAVDLGKIPRRAYIE